MRSVALSLLCLLLATAAFAQTTGGTQSGTSQSSGTQGSSSQSGTSQGTGTQGNSSQSGTQSGSGTWNYQPYKKDEFPQWALDLRRAETIFIGSFPIAMMVATLVYEGFRQVRSLAEGSMSPPVFGSYTTQEGTGLVVAGVSLSSVVTLLDFLLGKAKAQPQE